MVVLIKPFRYGRLPEFNMNYSNIRSFIHKEGYIFVGCTLGIALICLLFSTLLFWIFFILTLCFFFFFRNPCRVVPSDKNLIVSPACGTICSIISDVPPEELGLGSEQRYRVSVFLSIVDVHVNRSPANGKVKKILYSPGKYINAGIEKSSLFNERNTIILEVNDDPSNLMSFSQIAGTLARRIVCDVHEGEILSKGEVYGIIKFGSRSDIWLPVGSIPLVCVGQKVISGETVLCDMSLSNISLREGLVVP